MDLPFNKLVACLGKVLQGSQVPMVTSKPGVGKSALGRHIAELANLEYIDIRLQTYDVVSLNGYPDVDIKNNRSCFIPMSVIPIAGRDKLPKGKDGWLINFDEITTSVPAMQNAALKIILDRYVGEHKVHPDVFMMAAGNGMKDGAATHRLTSTMKSRMVHFGMASSPALWAMWATKAKIDPRIIAFIDARPELLNNFDPATVSTVTNFACERTWHILSDCIVDDPTIDADNYPIIEGAVGEAAAVEFNAFCNVFIHVPKYDEIVLAPYATPVPTEPAGQYAVINIIASKIIRKDVGAIMQYLNRFDSEFQLLAARRILRANTSWKVMPEFKAMIAKYAREFDFIR